MSADDKLLAEIATVSAELAAIERRAAELKVERIRLFMRARKREITTTRLAAAAQIEVGNVRQILNRAKD